MLGKKLVEWNGVVKSLSEWAAELGISRQAAHQRLMRGGSLDKVGRKVLFPLTFNGKTKSLHAWSKETGISVSTLRARRKRGLPPEEILRGGHEQQRDAAKIEHEGTAHTLREWNKLTGIPMSTLYARVHLGVPPREILKKGRLA